MDDKKRLEKALAVARDFYNGSDHAISHIEFKMALEAIFPELGQTESERIRTTLLEMVEWVRKQQSHTKGFNEVEWDKFIEWLESQKRLNPVVYGFGKGGKIDPDLNDYCCEVFIHLEKENGGVLSFARLQHLAIDIENWVRNSPDNKTNDDSKGFEWDPMSGDIVRLKGTEKPTYTISQDDNLGDFIFMQNDTPGLVGGNVSRTTLLRDYELVERPKTLEETLGEMVDKLEDDGKKIKPSSELPPFEQELKEGILKYYNTFLRTDEYVMNLSKRLREAFKDEILSEIDVEKTKKEYRDRLPFDGEYAQYGDALAHSFGEGLDAMVKLIVNRLIKPTK